MPFEHAYDPHSPKTNVPQSPLMIVAGGPAGKFWPDHAYPRKPAHKFNTYSLISVLWNHRVGEALIRIRTQGLSVQNEKSKIHEELSSLDLKSNDGLMKWSVATGIPVVALTRGSDFFYEDRHLLKDSKQFKSSENAYTVIKVDHEVVSAAVPEDELSFSLDRIKQSLRPIDRDRGYTYNHAFEPDSLDYSLLRSYLTTPDRVPHRKEIADTIDALPFTFVRALRGKALYLLDFSKFGQENLKRTVADRAATLTRLLNSNTTCNLESSRLINYQDGKSQYLIAKLSCKVDSRPSPGKVQSALDTFTNQGYTGWRQDDSSKLQLTLNGEALTGLCNAEQERNAK